VIPENKFPAGKKIQAKNCYICGYDNPRGLRIPFYYDGARVRSEFVPGRELCGFDNIVHGGIIYSLADEAMMHLIWAFGSKAVTAEIIMRYHGYARVNEKIALWAEFEEISARLIKAKCLLFDKNDKKIATARGKFLPFSKGDRDIFTKQF